MLKLSSIGETVVLALETRNMERNLPSVLTFEYDLLNLLTYSMEQSPS
jgi:hypothetical protein